jgi:hypothetical protein
MRDHDPGVSVAFEVQCAQPAACDETLAGGRVQPTWFDRWERKVEQARERDAYLAVLAQAVK